MSCMVTQAECECVDDLLGPSSSDFSVVHYLILAASLWFIVSSFPSPLKKKKSYLLLYFWLQNNSRWYILYRGKITEFFTLSVNYFPTFNFNEVINLTKDSFVKTLIMNKHTCVQYLIPLAKIKSIITLTPLYYLLPSYIFSIRC